MEGLPPADWPVATSVEQAPPLLPVDVGGPNPLWAVPLLAGGPVFYVKVN